MGHRTAFQDYTYLRIQANGTTSAKRFASYHSRPVAARDIRLYIRTYFQELCRMPQTSLFIGGTAQVFAKEPAEDDG